MMGRWRQNDLHSPFLWTARILMFFAIFVDACRGGCASDSKFLVKFMQAIDPEHVLDIIHDEDIPDLCSVVWVGIKCDMPSLSVTEIKLENMNLSGRIDADSLCKIPSLQVLSLANNLVHGVIPEAISNCLGLTYLNLSRNTLHGIVPPSLSRLKNLRTLDVSFTNLTGNAPRFEQDIELFVADTMTASTSNIKEDVIMTNFGEKSGRRPRGLKELATRWGMQLAAFLPLLLSLALYSLFTACAHKKITKLSVDKENKEPTPECPVKELSVSVSMEEADEKGGDVNLVFFSDNYKTFRIDELLQSAADLQGQNFYSTLYRVRLTDTAVFAVKRLKNLQVSGEEFRREFARIGKLKHPNLLPLVAFSSSENEKLLIYGYQRRGSLSSLLSSYAKKKGDLPWTQRLSIMSGIARGLDYIAREASKQNLAHGHLKPSNVMLSETEEPLISEYGICGFLDPTRAFIYPDGYRAPEKRLTKEADIFSFGVILLELLTGKIEEKGSLNLPKWVKSMVREEWTGEVFDKEVRNVGKQWAFPLLNIALRCVSDKPERRPNISEVLEKIEHVATSHQGCSFSSVSSEGSSLQDHTS